MNSNMFRVAALAAAAVLVAVFVTIRFLLPREGTAGRLQTQTPIPTPAQTLPSSGLLAPGGDVPVRLHLVYVHRARRLGVEFQGIAVIKFNADTPNGRWR